MLSVVVLGFTMERLKGYSDIAWASHDSSTAADLSNREYALIIEKVVVQADAVLVNLALDHLSSTDIVIMHHAYIHKNQSWVWVSNHWSLLSKILYPNE